MFVESSGIPFVVGVAFGLYFLFELLDLFMTVLAGGFGRSTARQLGRVVLQLLVGKVILRILAVRLEDGDSIDDFYAAVVAQPVPQLLFILPILYFLR